MLLKKKKLWLVIPAVLSLIFLAACGGGGGTSSGDNSQTSGDSNKQSYVLKLGHVGPADAEHPWEKFALEFASQIESRTNGQVKVNTYPASQLGADREMTEALQQGTLEMGLISTIAMGNFVPEFQVWDLPYIFPTDNAKVDAILDGAMGEKLTEKAKEKGLVVLAYWENDWRGMSNSKRPIESVEDMKGLKMRVVENKPSMDWFSRIGSIPTPMAFSEVYSALQQGTIDGQDNGYLLTYGSKLHEVQPYYTLTKHIYAPLAVVVSAQTWEQLPDEIKEEMRALAKELAPQQRSYSRQVAEEYKTKMQEAGVQISELSEEAIRGFQESAQGTYDALAQDIDKSLIDEMLSYRDGN